MNAAPTHNKLCDGVRKAHSQAKAGFPQLPKEDMATAIALAITARKLLADAYRLLQPHGTLSIQCETAGKSAAHLIAAIEARTAGRMQ